MGYQGTTDDGSERTNRDFSQVYKPNRNHERLLPYLIVWLTLPFIFLVWPNTSLKAAESLSFAQNIPYIEGAYIRVLTLSNEEWILDGTDADHFKVEAGALRFATPPDFETPLDANQDNSYELVLHSTSTRNRSLTATIEVEDRDEPGQARIVPHRPLVGEPVEVVVTDPDLSTNASPASVVWQRWIAPGEWQTINTTTAPRYIPTAADAGHYVRANLTYTDRHQENQSITAHLPNPVLGPMLLDLKVTMDSDRARPKGKIPTLRPAFDPHILHYGIPCDEEDVMTVSFRQPKDHRTSVYGIQPHPGEEGRAAVAVTQTSDVDIMVVARDGTYTTYTVHCMPPALWRIKTETDSDTPLEVLLAVTRGPCVTSDDVDEARVGYRIEPDTPNAEKLSIDVWTDPVARDEDRSTGAGLMWRW